MNLTAHRIQFLMMVYQARLETTMRSFPSSAEVAREAELEKQELAMKRKRSAHEVRITVTAMLIMDGVGMQARAAHQDDLIDIWISVLIPNNREQ